MVFEASFLGQTSTVDLGGFVDPGGPEHLAAREGEGSEREGGREKGPKRLISCRGFSMSTVRS